MVAGLVQQCEDQRILTDEWMESETTIKTDETGAAHTKRLRVHDPSLRIDFIFDAGERGPKFTHQNFQHATAAYRTAKGDITWQRESVQHGGSAVCALPIVPNHEPYCVDIQPEVMRIHFSLGWPALLIVRAAERKRSGWITYPRNAPMSGPAQSRRFDDVRFASAFSPIATCRSGHWIEGGCGRNSRFGLKRMSHQLMEWIPLEAALALTADAIVRLARPQSIR
jgi:hypothetical protein